MRFETDKTGLYRQHTKTMTPSPGSTFKCCRCGQCKSIMGRKKVGMIGKRRLFACVGCLESK